MMKKVTTFFTLLLFCVAGMFAEDYDALIREQDAIIAKATNEKKRLEAELSSNEEGNRVNVWGDRPNADIERDIACQNDIIEAANRKKNQLMILKNQSRPDINLPQVNRQNNQHQRKSQRIAKQNKNNRLAKQKAAEKRVDAAARKAKQEAQQKAEDETRRHQAGINAQKNFDVQNQASYQNKLNLTNRNNQALYNYAQNSGFEQRLGNMRGTANKKPAAPHGVTPQYRENQHQHQNQQVIQEAPPAQWQTTVIPLNTDF